MNKRRRQMNALEDGSSTMTSRGYLSGVVMAAALLVAPQAAVAAGFANTAQSATQSGMSGVATANPDEPASNFYNPASMAFDEDWNIYLGATTLIPSVDYESLDGEFSHQTEDQVFYPPNFNLNVPISDGFALGVGATFPWGLGIAWPDDWVGQYEFRSQDLQTFNLNPSVAMKVPAVEGLSVAAGAQFVRSSITQERAQMLPGTDDVDIVLGGTGHGIGATLAAMYEVNDEVTLGMNYRSAVRVSYDGAIHFGDAVNDTPFQHRFIDQDITTEITMPHTLNTGVGYQLNDALWMGLDVNYMTWRTYDQVEIGFSEQSPEGERGELEPPLMIEADWNDAVALRLGGQYRLIPGVKVRGGFAYDMTPVPDDTVGPSLPDNDRFVFSTGVGYTQMGTGIRADLGYQFITLPTREIRNDTVEGDYQLSSHVIGLNVGYGF